MAGAIVLPQHEGEAVRGLESIEIAVVVVIAKVRCPHLLTVFQAIFRSQVGIIVRPVVHEEAIPAAAIVRAVHALAAMADVQVDVPVIVEVARGASVVAAHIAGGARAGRSPRHHVRRVHGRATGVRQVNVAGAHIIAGEHINAAVVVEVGHGHALGENVRPGQIGQRVNTACRDMHVVGNGNTGADILVPVVVQIGDGPAPLAAVLHRTIVEGDKGVVRVLVEDVHMFAHVQLDDVIQAVVIHVGHAHARTATGVVRQAGTGIGEIELGHRPGREERGGDEWVGSTHEGTVGLDEKTARSVCLAGGRK